ncbi:hypothetical protein CF161_13568 [Pseudomonas sp. CF161]|nr:hypothetical protein CF161_13568 [Pseudomonas sp. CF161]
MDFEKLVVWQRSKSLAVDIYREFARCEDFAFKSQITRSALSVPSNIAEGMERRSAREKCCFSGLQRLPTGSCARRSSSAVRLPTSQSRWLKIGLQKLASFQKCSAA